MRVQLIVFGEEGISIEYADESDGKFPKSSQITIPYSSVTDKYPELSNDITEVMQDVDALLDSAILASMNGKVRSKQMGVE